jgi:glycosyltransferase involved in cell wall biosynthesis
LIWFGAEWMSTVLNIALMGTRGVPANYGGFETCAEQLGIRLAQRGHRVTVYGRSQYIQYSEPTYKGMHLLKMPTILNKYLDTFYHTFVTTLHATFNAHYDVILYFNAGNSPLVWMPRLARTRTILNVDGLDWKRDKWPPLAKKYIQLGERLSAYLPNVFLTDSRVVQDYYRERFNAEAVYIPYGSEVETVPPGEMLAKYGLEQRKYVLFVGRLVAENSVDHLIEAFKQIDTNMKCVIVGGASYDDSTIAALKAAAQDDPRIIFTGYLFGEGYYELGSNACVFVETSGVGGTHPALTEAMGFGNCIIVNDTHENQETIGDAGLCYDGSSGAESLREVLQKVITHPEIAEDLRRAARSRAQAVYSWEAVADSYERLMYGLLKRPVPERLALNPVEAY